MTKSDAVTAVQILGEEYRIRGASSERIEALAAYVDSKFRELEQGGGQIKDMKRQAVLVTMNIAEEIFEQRTQSREQSDSLRYRLRQCRDYLGSATGTNE